MKKIEDLIIEQVKQMAEGRDALSARLDTAKAAYAAARAAYAALVDVIHQQQAILDEQHEVIQVIREMTSKDISGLQYGSHYGHRRLYEAIIRMRRLDRVKES